MKILLLAAIGIILTQVTMSLMTNMDVIAQERGAMTRNSEATDALVEAGQTIRSAWETYERNGACPAGTDQRTLSYKQVCWPSGRVGSNLDLSTSGGGDVSGGFSPRDCFRSRSGSTLCLDFNAVPVSFWREFELLPSAYAQSYFDSRSPASTGPAGGVRLVAPTCGSAADTPCINCADPNTTCFNITFCVNAAPGCAAESRWVQTIAFRRLAAP